MKASDANELLCDNTVKTHHVSRSDYFKKTWLLDKIFSKKKSFYFRDIYIVYKDLKANKVR